MIIIQQCLVKIPQTTKNEPGVWVIFLHLNSLGLMPATRPLRPALNRFLVFSRMVRTMCFRLRTWQP